MWNDGVWVVISRHHMHRQALINSALFVHEKIYEGEFVDSLLLHVLVRRQKLAVEGFGCISCNLVMHFSWIRICGAGVTRWFFLWSFHGFARSAVTVRLPSSGLAKFKIQILTVSSLSNAGQRLYRHIKWLAASKSSSGKTPLSRPFTVPLNAIFDARTEPRLHHTHSAA